MQSLSINRRSPLLTIGTAQRCWLLFSAYSLVLGLCPIDNAWSSNESNSFNNISLFPTSVSSFTTQHFSSIRNNNEHLQLDIHISNAIPSQGFISPGVYGGMSMDMESFNATSPPDLHVEFIVQTLDNMIVKQAGVSRYMRINWSVHSAEASFEPSFNPDSWVPSPGNSLHFNDAPIYIGVVLDGCGKVPVYPINFYSEVYSGTDIIGNFSASDTSHIRPNGYWNFSYTIRVNDIKGNLSDIIVKGIVRATCEW